MALSMQSERNRMQIASLFQELTKIVVITCQQQYQNLLVYITQA